ELVVSDPVERPLASTSPYLDACQHRETAEQLRQREARWAMTLEASRDGIVVEENRLIVYVNKAFAHLHGYNGPEEIIGKHISLGQAARGNRQMLDLEKAGVPDHTAPTLYEFRGIRKDGTVIELEASISRYEISGRTGTVTVVRDTAERKCLMAALNASERRY